MDVFSCCEAIEKEIFDTSNRVVAVGFVRSASGDGLPTIKIQLTHGEGKDVERALREKPYGKFIEFERGNHRVTPIEDK